jgi:diacylglycerol kinase family enzyme
MGKKKPFCPDAVMDDGLFDVCILKRAPILSLLGYVVHAHPQPQTFDPVHAHPQPSTLNPGPHSSTGQHAISMTSTTLRILALSDTLHRRCFLRSSTGKHVALPFVEYCKAKRLRLTPSNGEGLTGQGMLNIDGELTGNSPYELNTRPGLLELFCP